MSEPNTHIDRHGTRDSPASTSNAPPLKRSVEVEYWVIDHEGYLVEPGDLVDATDGAEREFVEPMLEIKTTPCETTAALERELFERIRAVVRRAAEQDKGLVPLATPIGRESIAEIPCDRTQIQNQVIGEDFEYVRHCAGTHIHVEQQPGREIEQVNTLIALDPALALLNSSPYYDGLPLATGARSKLYRHLAYDGLAHQGRLWPYAEDTTEWTARLEARYDEFVTEALECGVDGDALESCFDPESAVWTPVQLRETFPTVEWRSPDTGLPSQVVQLADDVAGVVERVRDPDVTVRIGDEGSGERGRGRKPERERRPGHVTDTEILLPTFETVIEYVETAIADGLSPDVQAYLERMGFDVEAYEPASPDLAHGPVSPEKARELRLEYATRLEADVRQVHSVVSD